MSGLTFNNLSKRQFILGSALLLLVAFFYLLPVCFILRGNTDQGYMPLGADMILQGKFICKDMWSVVLPGSYLWLALWLKLFGETWFVAKSVLLVTILAIVALLLAISRCLIKSWLVFLPASILFAAGAPPWGCNYHHWDSLLTVLVCSLILLRLLNWPAEKTLNGLALAFFAGVFAGLSICCMQSLAPTLVLGLATAAYLCSRSESNKSSNWKVFFQVFLAEMLGLALVLAALLTYLVATGTLSDCINSTITFILQNYETVNREPYGHCVFFDKAVLAMPWRPGNEAVCISSWIIGGLVWLPFEIVKESPIWVAIALIIYKLRRGSISQAITNHPQVLLLLVLGFGYWLVEWHRPDINRLLWGSQLLMILLFYFAEYAYANIAKLRLTVALFSSLTVVGVVLNIAVTSAFYLAPKHMLETRWGKIAALDDLKIVEVIEKVTKPHEKVLVYPYDTTVNFLSKTRFPSIHPWLQYNFNTKEQMQSTVDDMEKSKVQYVVWDISRGNQTFTDLGYSSYIPVAHDQLIIEPYLLKHYDFVKQYGRFRLMKRKPAGDSK